jgi:hypothetical protein
MHKFRKVAATLAAAGLTAFGAVAATGGAASAATGLPLSQCSVQSASLVSAAALTATCTAGTSTIYNPTSLTFTVDPSFFTVLLGNSIINGLLGGVLSAHVTYHLTCLVDGSQVTSTNDTGFTVSSAAHNTHTVDLQSAVGSPNPNSCTVSNLTVSSALAANVLGEIHLLGLNFTFGVSEAGDNGVPGAIFSESTPNSHGAIPALCADDTGNGNHGTTIQSYTCESDLADQWLQTAANQFTHNGDCLDNVGGIAKLSSCVANPGSTNSQVWSTVNEGHGLVELVNTANSDCLTDATPTDGSALTVASCTGAQDQLWKVPAVTPV